MRKQNVVPERRFMRWEYSTAHFWNTPRARQLGKVRGCVPFGRGDVRGDVEQL
uniref:Uncharacterized protein n=1 Tax=virus sp. ctL1g6 TaxID=2827988 RepID=A0A8S5REI0_9VIRU|nr:MAG TPA: hypothetical protein [virus sp. ctL1g6]